MLWKRIKILYWQNQFWFIVVVACLVLTVLSATVAVFVLVAQAANPALAFLVSGLVLLMAAAGATLLGKRRT